MPEFSRWCVGRESGVTGVGDVRASGCGVSVYAQFSRVQSEGAQASLSRLQTQAWLAAIQSEEGRVVSKMGSMFL